jgi:hypothetical protein
MPHLQFAGEFEQAVGYDLPCRVPLPAESRLKELRRLVVPLKIQRESVTVDAILDAMREPAIAAPVDKWIL